MLGLTLQVSSPLSALDVNVKHVREMGMYTLPLLGVHDETLHDDALILEQILAGDIRIVEMVVARRSIRIILRRCSGGDRLDRHPDHDDWLRADIGATAVRGLAGAVPSHATVLPQYRAAAVD